MKIILTNDDGIDAPGLDALEAALPLDCSHVIVAPRDPCSGFSHQVTTDRPLQLTPVADDRYHVDGTPVDCVRLALTEIMPDADFLLTGINLGGNLGADIYISGTVAAAREATLMGCPAMAISQYVGVGRKVHWDVSTRRAKPVIADLLAGNMPQHALWNINLPHPPDDQEQVASVICSVDFLPLDIRYRSRADGYTYAGNYHQRPRTQGHDVDICFGGRIAVSAIPVRFQTTPANGILTVATGADHDYYFR